MCINSIPQQSQNKYIKTNKVSFGSSISDGTNSLERSPKIDNVEFLPEKSNLISRILDNALEFRRERKFYKGLGNKTSKNAHTKLLKSIKDKNNKTKYSKDEINAIINSIPNDIEMKGKDLYRITTLEDISASKAVDILKKIDTKDKYHIFQDLFDINEKYRIESLDIIPKTKWNYADIDTIFENLKNNIMAKPTDFYHNVLDNYYKRINNGAHYSLLPEYIINVSKNINTTSAGEDYERLLWRIDSDPFSRTLNANEIFALYKNRKHPFIDDFGEFDEIKMTKTAISLQQSIAEKIENSTDLDETEKRYFKYLTERVDDEKVLEYIDNTYESTHKLTIKTLINSILEAKKLDNPSRFNMFYQTTLYQQFLNHLKDEGIDEIDIYKYIDVALPNNQQIALPTDMELNARFSSMKEFFAITKNNLEINKYLYENYYLKTLNNIGVNSYFTERLKAIHDKYGVKIMLSANTAGIHKKLEIVEREFDLWLKHSKGEAKLPPVLDFSTTFHNFRTYNGAVWYGLDNFMTLRKDRDILGFWKTLRHELMHVNDTKRGKNIDPKYNLEQWLDYDSSPAIKEFKKANIDESYQRYAMKNTKELISVAISENTEKYSEEFKRTLEDFGCPKWVFNIPRVELSWAEIADLFKQYIKALIKSKL